MSICTVSTSMVRSTALDKFFEPLKGHFHWEHFIYFRLLVVTIALMWGRRNVSNL
jgi:hypothetical protein